MNIPIYRPFVAKNTAKYVNQCLEENWISSKGRFIENFQDSFSEYLGVSHSSTVTNGTVALHLALLSLGIVKGDEVIVPNFTYIASVNAIAYVGAKPIPTFNYKGNIFNPKNLMWGMWNAVDTNSIYYPGSINTWVAHDSNVVTLEQEGSKGLYAFRMIGGMIKEKEDSLLEGMGTLVLNPENTNKYNSAFLLNPGIVSFIKQGTVENGSLVTTDQDTTFINRSLAPFRSVGYLGFDDDIKISGKALFYTENDLADLYFRFSNSVDNNAEADDVSLNGWKSTEGWIALGQYTATDYDEVYLYKQTIDGKEIRAQETPKYEDTDNDVTILEERYDILVTRNRLGQPTKDYHLKKSNGSIYKIADGVDTGAVESATTAEELAEELIAALTEEEHKTLVEGASFDYDRTMLLVKMNEADDGYNGEFHPMTTEEEGYLDSVDIPTIRGEQEIKDHVAGVAVGVRVDDLSAGSSALSTGNFYGHRVTQVSEDADEDSSFDTLEIDTDVINGDDDLYLTKDAFYFSDADSLKPGGMSYNTLSAESFMVGIPGTEEFEHVSWGIMKTFEQDGSGESFSMHAIGHLDHRSVHNDLEAFKASLGVNTVLNYNTGKVIRAHFKTNDNNTDVKFISPEESKINFQVDFAKGKMTGEIINIKANSVEVSFDGTFQNVNEKLEFSGNAVLEGSGVTNIGGEFKGAFFGNDANYAKEAAGVFDAQGTRDGNVEKMTGSFTIKRD